MTIFQAIFLGVIQGITEFIPISSSAHLALLPYFVNWHVDPAINFIFDILVQFATLGAVIVYYRKDLLHMAQSIVTNIVGKKNWSHPDSRLAIAIVIGTLPVVVLGLPLKGAVEEAFKQPLWIGFALLITSLILFLSEKRSRNRTISHSLTYLDALLIGIWQTLAIFPGISRSGATIAGGLFRNLDRSQATRFAFLLSIPSLAGAGVLSLIDFIRLPNPTQYLPVIIPGCLAAFVVGYLSIYWLIRYLQNHSLYLFSTYCLILGIIVILSKIL
ncbi:MAG: undecaprenyl-diphosphate phosphatase [Anaerolineales bacterium]